MIVAIKLIHYRNTINVFNHTIHKLNSLVINKYIVNLLTN